MRILLLRPPDPLLRRMSLWPPLGLGYLAATVRDHHEVEVLDALAEGLGPPEAAARVVAWRPDLLGISLHTQSWLAAGELLGRVRAALPGVITVAGGPHISGEPAPSLRKLPALDYGVRGEAEGAFPALVALLAAGEPCPEALAAVPGLVFRDGAEIRVGEPARVEDLGELPRPARDLLHEERFPVNQLFRLGTGPHALIGASRGCPQACSFCGIRALHGPGIRLRDPRDVLAEVDELVRARGVRTLLFVDDNITAERDWALELFAGLAESFPGLGWSPVHGLRLDTLDAALVRALEASGCFFFYAGIESGSQRLLELVRKGCSLDDVREKLALVRRHSGIRVGGFFILGLPGETVEDLIATIRFARSLKLDRAVFLPATLSPGSPLHREAQAAGSIDDHSGQDYTVAEGYRLIGQAAGRSQPPLSLLQALHLAAYAGFYSQPRLLLRAPLEISPRGLAQALRVVGSTFRHPGD